MSMFLGLLYPLGLTFIIEYPIMQCLWLLLKEKSTSKIVFFDGRFILLPVIIVNVLTNPPINIYARYLFYETAYSEKDIWLIISLWEVVVFLVEGIMYKHLLKTKMSKAILMSLCANGVSYLSSFI